jgi:DNA-directed RNA polymerase specialized sigma24 family protein
VGGVPRDETTRRQGFEEFVLEHGPRLHRALIARYGLDVGPETYAEALACAWAHWDRIETMSNPIGYLYRVGQSASRRFRRRTMPTEVESVAADHALPDPELHEALWSLPAKYRTAVLLVHGHGFRYREAADTMNVSEAALRNYVHRGLTALRRALYDSEVSNEPT